MYIYIRVRVCARARCMCRRVYMYRFRYSVRGWFVHVWYVMCVCARACIDIGTLCARVCAYVYICRYAMRVRARRATACMYVRVRARAFVHIGIC